MEFDLAIIGGGPGGYLAAIKAAQKGKNVCLIDKDRLGGVCLNWGCIPTKALIKNAEVYNYVKNSEKYGIIIKDYSVDFKKNIKRSRNVSDRLSKGIQYLIKKNNITHIQGKGILKSENQILVESQKKSILVKANYIILAMGARPKSFPGLEFDYKRIISSKESMVLDSVPKKIIIIGSGAIGCEFSYYFNEFGSEVHLIEAKKNILPVEDVDVSKELEREFKKSGIFVYKNSNVIKTESLKTKVKVHLSEKDKVHILEADYALLAIGVTGNIENSGIENVGIISEDGSIKVNKYNQTNIPNIYAIGDVSGPPWLAHVASAQGVVSVEHAFEDNAETIDYNNIPGCTYTQPQVGSIGLTERVALSKGFKIKVGKYSFRSNGKAMAVGHNDGFIKLIFDEKYGELLGAHIIGSEATELIGQLSMAKALESTWEDLAFGVFAHPTFSEAIMEAALDAYDIGIHQ
ncbi:MAG: dihydrolipoyl dehydrogenase [Candidatus Neomarinimicrobiota bacterium]